MDLRQLKVIGITYNQIESGVYALLLQEAGGRRRLPIVIGTSEAQSIECSLQKIVTPRPLTHDLMVNMLRRFGLRLKRIVIRQLEGGVFAADLHIVDPLDGKEALMDARSSDAVALALRMCVPIYADSELLDKIGLLAPADRPTPEPLPDTLDLAGDLYKSMSEDQLKQMMREAVQKERYEEASRIKAELDRRDAEAKAK